MEQTQQQPDQPADSRPNRHQRREQRVLRRRQGTGRALPAKPRNWERKARVKRATAKASRQQQRRVARGAGKLRQQARKAHDKRR